MMNYDYLWQSHGKSFKANIKGEPVEGKISVYKDRIYLCQDSYEGEENSEKFGYRYSWIITHGGKITLDGYNIDVTNLIVEGMERNLKLSITKARELFGKNQEVDQLILQIFTEEELKPDLSWESVRREMGILETANFSTLVERLTRQDYEKELAKLKLKLIADKINDGEKAEYCIYKDSTGSINIGSPINGYKYGFITFKSYEVAEKVLEANRSLIETILS